MDNDPVEEYNNSNTTLSWEEFQLSKLSKDIQDKVLNIKNEINELNIKEQKYNNEINLINKKKDLIFNKIILLNKEYQKNILPECTVCGIPSYSKYCSDCW